MTLIEIIQLVVGSGGLIGIAFLIFRTGRIVEKIETTNADLIEFKEDVKKEFDKTDQKLSSFRKEVKDDFERSRSDVKSEIASVGGELLMVREDIKRMQVDVSDVKERVAFIEAFVFFSEFKAESNNSRSEAAKKMWERRKMKKLGSKP